MELKEELLLDEEQRIANEERTELNWTELNWTELNWRTNEESFGYHNVLIFWKFF